MVSPRTVDPPFAAAFVFKVDDIEIGRFTEVSGLAVTMEIEEITEGGNNESTIKMPGRLTWPNLVLKRGITDDDELLSWITTCASAIGGEVSKSTGSVTLYTGTHTEFRRWEFRDAMPVRWTGPQFAASGNALASEELEVCHGGFVSS